MNLLVQQYIAYVTNDRPAPRRHSNSNNLKLRQICIVTRRSGIHITIIGMAKRDQAKDGGQ
jgi:hypothetical protein